MIPMTAITRVNSSPAIPSSITKLHPRGSRRPKPIPCSHSFAGQLFNEIHHRDVSREAALISSLSRQGEPFKALDLFRELACDSQRNPAALPLAVVLRCCASLQAVNSGREVQAFLLRNGGGKAGAHRTQSALVSFYSKCGFLSLARKVFDDMPIRDVVSWTIILMAYANGEGLKGEAMCLFLEMLRNGAIPNRHTLTVIMGCASPVEGKQLQAYIAKQGWDYDAFTGSALIDMYAKNGDLDDAQLAFDRIEHKDAVCYNSLLSGYGRKGLAHSLMKVFDEMCSAGIAPNQSTLVGLLNSCASAGLMSLSKQFHAHAIARGFSCDEVLRGIIIDMYAKCGDLESARAAFEQTGAAKSIPTWNSMICGYGKHGCPIEALHVFNSMQKASIPPDHITFTCLLSACSHSGMVDEGWKLFDFMREVSGVSPRNEHYACMVDLLGRAGKVREAYEFISRSNVDLVASVWGALLASCKLSGDADIGEIAARKLFEIEPECSGSYVGLAGIFTANERWVDAVEVRRLMDGNGVRKEAGHSLIDVGGSLGKFRAGEGDKMDCHELEELMFVCRRLNSNIVGYGYEYHEILVGLDG